MRLFQICICIAVMTGVGLAQSTVTTSGTTSSGTVPVFNGTATVTNSPIAISGSNVGIGTTSPGQALSVIGSVGIGNISIFTPNGLDNSLTISQAGPLKVMAVNVGIGTLTPKAPLEIMGTSSAVSGARNAIYLDNGNSSGNRSNDIVFGYNGGSRAWEIGNDLAAAGTQDLYIFDDSGGGVRFYIGSGGNVGIGTTSPAAKLEINGNFKLTSGSGGSITYADGTTQTTAWTGVLCGGDYAESVNVIGDRSKFGPGDVLVIDPDHPDKFLKSAEPYSTAVLGVYSTKPGVLGRHQTGPKTAEEVPLAMVGIVPTKVSTENGPIHPGDLLVTSSTPGYAMKATDRSRMLGAVLGKALSRLDSGKGVIEVGVTLQ